MPQQVIVIAGPTGVGKSACSVQLAKQLQGEIISGDSMQVYQELSIGTAKIKADEMEMVPHHLVDCFSIQDEYNVKIFQEIARKKMVEIANHGHLPIICGGTGLYIKSLLYDYTFVKQEGDVEFDAFLASLSNSQLYLLLKHVDEAALDTIHRNNHQRLIRALQMAHLGDKKSELIAKQEHKLLYDAYCIGLTCDRSYLYERINQRVDKMMEAGLLEEMQALVMTYGDSIWNLQSMQSIGYKEWKPYFEKTMDVSECVELIKKNSRNFAKRQYTWFENQMPMHWYDISKPDWMKQLWNDINLWIK